MVRGDNEGQPGVDGEADADPRVPPPRIEIEVGSATVLQGHREIVIRHAGHRYRLRITANDKLILTK